MLSIKRISIALPAIAGMLLAGECGAQTTSSANPLQIQSVKLPVPVARQRYEAQLTATGGQPPYRWSVLSKALPFGLALNAGTGLISGTPQSNQEFSVLVQVMDSSDPPLTQTKLLLASTTAALSIDWASKPQVQGASISGAVRISNGSKDDFDLTLIIVAVNEYGRAVALRYEHFTLAHQTDSPTLQFTSTLPMGHYVVHADAVAEVPAKNAIYRDRKQQAGLIVQTQ
jgi:hypothetical protein